VRWAAGPWLGPLQPLAPGFPMIAAASLLLGWRPAVLTAIVSYIGGQYLFMDPRLLTTVFQDVAAVLVYGVSAALVILLGHLARRARAQLAEANERLIEADRRKDQFLAELSHELRNPVGVIATAVSMLETHNTDSRLRGPIGVLARQVTQIRRLVDDLLDVGRVTRGRLVLHPEASDLRNCIDQAVEGTLSTVASKQQTVRVSMPETPVTLPVDHARMVQVITNLIDNASKYSPGRTAIEVTLADRDDVQIDVADAGPGIDPAVLPRVFDLYEQGKRSSTSEGLGVGLGLCKHIVEMHGGTIEAAANPQGRGSNFTIRLPRVPRALPHVGVSGSAGAQRASL
jgi:signal transduction histidine kinase